MRRSRKYQPYVRLANGREKSESVREAFRIAFYESLGRPFYVMVQRGFPNNAIAVGATKREVQASPVVVRFKRKTFKQWAKSIQRLATKKGGAT